MRVTTMTPTTTIKHRALEDVLCSKTAWKILKLLLGSQLTPSQIATLVGANYHAVSGHLEALEAEGIVTCVMFGKRIRFYKLNETSPVASAIRDLIEIFSEQRAQVS